jgi:(1->4)-alpha-D-glucan 1-alpha-D-glucosylmutase
VTELRATYRLQLGPGLRFADARALVPYLRDLGVSHLYLSPSLQARSGSTHGYDQVDPTRVSEELGGEEELRALAGEGLGVILDIVPNHMGTGDENPSWRDPEIFDIDPETDFGRRFFDIDDLGAIRMERQEVFDLVHGKVLELIADGVVDGVRVDHPDGLADPAGYFDRLRAAGPGGIWVEKILHPGEPMRDWPVDGTVGYEFLVDLQTLFVDPRGEESLTALYSAVTGSDRRFEDVALEAQKEQATQVFHREVAWLERLAPGVEGIAEALAELPVYRTYVEPWSGKVDDLDRRYLAGLPEPLRRILTLEEQGFDEFVTRFQQFSPPVTAKGIEDTAFYRYNRLLALNEVGNDPGRFSLSVDDFHAANAQRAERFPRNLLISSTHDTKRSADTRARIGALAGMVDEFASLVAAAPFEEDPNTGWMVLQNLLGTWPIEMERIDAYLEKALREAKVHTNWASPDEDYERRVQQWARSIMENHAVRAVFDPLCDRVTVSGRRSAMGQLLVKLTAPGVPDVYGGDELEFRALVDPDNRRPVDFDLRRRMLASGDDPKLSMIQRALQLRAERPAAFSGAYEPVDAGPECLAYWRGAGEVLAVVPIRGYARLSGVSGSFRDVLSGRTCAADDVFAAPALLVPA